MHKYSMLIFTFILIISMAEHASAYQVKTFKPLKISPLTVPYDNPAINESYPKITQLELNLFKRAYEKQNIYDRLTRIENKIFKRDFSAMPLSNRVDNILANIDPGIMYNISSKELAKIESKVLGRTYINDDTESRITRLEKEMLGAMQGGNLTERFDTVKTASKHYNSYPELIQSQSVYPQYNNSNYSYQMSNNWAGTRTRRGISGFMQNLLGTVFGDFSAGNLTGFTPPIYDPYNPYGGYNPGMGTQNYYMGNHGGFIDNRNIGNTSTVKILD